MRARREQFEAAYEALMAEARAGGAHAAGAALKAARAAEGEDDARALEAYGLAATLAPDNASASLGLARLKAETGDLDGARALALSVFAEARNAPERARAALLTGDIARASGRASEARDAYEAAIALEEQALTRDPASAVAHRWRARAEGRLADLDIADGQSARARERANGALMLLTALGAAGQEAPVLAADRADAELRMAQLDIEARDFAGARAHLVEAIGRYEALCVQEPGEAHWRSQLAQAWTHAAEAAIGAADGAQAREAMDRALALRVKLARADGRERWRLAACWRMRAALLTALGGVDEASASLMQARAIGEELVDENPHSEEAALFCAHALIEQADAALNAEHCAVALDCAEDARARAERWGERSSGAREWTIILANAFERLAGAQLALGAPARALEPAARAVDLRLKLAESAPGETGPARALAGALERLGLAARGAGDKRAASMAWRQAWRLVERLFGARDEDEAQRMCAAFETHLADLGEVDAEKHRASALARLAALTLAGRAHAQDERLRARLLGEVL